MAEEGGMAGVVRVAARAAICVDADVDAGALVVGVGARAGEVDAGEVIRVVNAGTERRARKARANLL